MYLNIPFYPIKHRFNPRYFRFFGPLRAGCPIFPFLFGAAVHSAPCEQAADVDPCPNEGYRCPDHVGDHYSVPDSRKFHAQREGEH